MNYYFLSIFRIIIIISSSISSSSSSSSSSSIFLLHIIYIRGKVKILLFFMA